jgi:hypothetical protein
MLTLGFGDEEPDVDKAKDEHAEEDEEDEWANVLRDVWCKVREEEVPEPV